MNASVKTPRLILLSITVLLLSCNSDLGISYSTTIINSNQVEDNLFIKTINWGITGNSQTTTISTTDDVDFNKTESEDYYIFQGLEPFFYKQSNDTLYLFSQTIVKVPKNFKSNWKIIQTYTNNPTFMDYHKDNSYNMPNRKRH